MNRLPYIVLFLLVLSSCRMDREEFTNETGQFGFPTIEVSASLYGYVSNDVGAPVEGAQVKANALVTVTDAEGYYEFRDQTLLNDGTVIEASQEIYSSALQLYMPNAGSEQRTDLILERRPIEQVDASAGGTAVRGNVQLNIAPGSVRTASGAIYDGTVFVKMGWKQPESLRDMLNSAGNFPGLGQDGELLSLESYGMIDLELTGLGGEILTISADNPAELLFPLEEQTFAAAPDEIPVWRLSEGFWQEIGLGVKGDLCYVVPVTTSGNYNCDVPGTFGRICGRLVDEAGIPLPHQLFSIRVAGGQTVYTAETDCEGNFCASVQADVELELLVEIPCSDNEFVVVPIGSNPAGTTIIGDIEVSIDVDRLPVVVTDCEGAPVSPDFARILTGGLGNGLELTVLNTDGTATIPIYDCNDDPFSIQAITPDGRRASSFVLRNPSDVSPLDLSICPVLDSEEYFTFTIEEENIEITEASVIFQNSIQEGDYRLWAIGVTEGLETNLMIELPALAVGTYGSPESFSFAFQFPEGESFNSFLSFGRTNPPVYELEIIAVGPDQSWIEGRLEFLADRYNWQTEMVEATELSVTATFRINL